MADLAKSVTRSLADSIGMRLRRVVIRALDGEIRSRSELSEPRLYVGGELRLDFETISLFVSWVQNEGWPVFCSIGVRPNSLFSVESTLVDWDVGDLDPWSKCTGQHLLAARVFVVNETPHVVEFSFPNQSFWVANGSEELVGDGTDLLIRAGRFSGLDGARLVWPVQPDRPTTRCS